jgi:hypothetical protein
MNVTRIYVWLDLSWISEDEEKDLEVAMNARDDFEIVDVPGDVDDIDAWLQAREAERKAAYRAQFTAEELAEQDTAWAISPWNVNRVEK